MRALAAVFACGLAFAQGDRAIPSEAGVGTVAFSADGNSIRGLCLDGKLRIWDFKSGAVVKTVAWDAGDTAATLTADGVATVGKDGAVKVWDVSTGKAIRRMTTTGPVPQRLSVARDGRIITSGKLGESAPSENLVRVWDAAGKMMYSIPSGVGGMSGVTISPDGTAVIGASYDADVRAWSARNGELLRLIDEIPVSMFDLKFSPDGKILAGAGADRTVYLYDTKSWKLLRKLEGQPEMISAMSFSADGKLLATGGFSELTQRNPVQVIVWDVETGKQLRTVKAPSRVGGASLSPDGKWLAVATGAKQIEVWGVGR